MLQYVDYSFAVGNAHKSVLNIADQIVGRMEENDFKEALDVVISDKL